MNVLAKVVFIAVLILNVLQVYSYAKTKPSGRIIKREGDIVTLNLGYNTNVILGSKFDVYIEKQVLLPLSNNQILISSDKTIGKIQIIQVDSNTSKAKIISELEDNAYKIEPMCFVIKSIEDGYSNQTLLISSININPAKLIRPGAHVEVKVDVHNQDLDTLIYTWKTDSSYFLSNKTTKPVNYWIAPFEEGSFTITVSVNDQRGGYDQKGKDITVKLGDGNNLGKYKELRIFKNQRFSNLELLHILDVGFDNENNMYVLDLAGHCIRVYSPNGKHPNGKYLKTLCDGKLSSPNDILVENNKIYVIYNNNKNVERYDLKGKLKVTYSKTLYSMHDIKRDIGVIKKPVALAVGKEGELYVIDGNGPNISVFEKDGRFRMRFGNSKELISTLNHQLCSIITKSR